MVYWVITLGVLCVNVYVIRHSPVNAITVGRKLNNEQQKDNAKTENKQNTEIVKEVSTESSEGISFLRLVKSF